MKMYNRILRSILCFVLCGCTGNQNACQNESELAYRSQLFSYLMFMQLESEGCQLNFKVASSDSLALYTELKESIKLAFFHSEVNCNSCVESNISFLNDLGDSIGRQNIIFLTSYRHKRDLVVFKRINQIKFPVYNVGSTGLAMEELNEPFLFIINEHLKAECVFVPIKEDSLHLKRYLNLIKQKYFSDNKLSIQL